MKRISCYLLQLSLIIHEVGWHTFLMQRSLNLNLYIRSSWHCMQKLQIFPTRIISVYYQQFCHLKAIEISVDISFDLCCRSKKFLRVITFSLPTSTENSRQFSKTNGLQNQGNHGNMDTKPPDKDAKRESKKKKYERIPVPTDGGYGWVIVVSVAYCLFCAMRYTPRFTHSIQWYSALLTYKFGNCDNNIHLTILNSHKWNT